MDRRDRCSAADDIVIRAWRYAQAHGRTSAERIAVFDFEMAWLEQRCADIAHSYAKKRRL
jgi:hypothetical protein